eukprot:UN23402
MTFVSSKDLGILSCLYLQVNFARHSIPSFKNDFFESYIFVFEISYRYNFIIINMYTCTE